MTDQSGHFPFAGQRTGQASDLAMRDWLDLGDHLPTSPPTPFHLDASGGGHEVVGDRLHQAEIAGNVGGCRPHSIKFVARAEQRREPGNPRGPNAVAVTVDGLVSPDGVVETAERL